MVQGSYPLFFQKSSGLSLVSDTLISDTRESSGKKILGGLCVVMMTSWWRHSVMILPNIGGAIAPQPPCRRTPWTNWSDLILVHFFIGPQTKFRQNQSENEGILSIFHYSLKYARVALCGSLASNFNAKICAKCSVPQNENVACC